MAPPLRPHYRRTAVLFREARPARAWWNVVKTLALQLPLWTVFFGVLPLLVALAESTVGLDAYRFGGSDQPFWLFTGIVLLHFGSMLHLFANLNLAVYGEGTPLPLDGPRRLVIAGPYRYVRNPS